MFVFRRPFTAVIAGLVTTLIAVSIDTAFASAWTVQHAAGLY
ncbi:MAG TPA: hypothetical protein VH856_03605 [Steroidobacteraceae bacterium]|jgi:hypothetical protein